MRLKSWPLWLKLSLFLDLLVIFLAGGFGTLWLWAMLPYAPPEVDRTSILAENAAINLLFPLIAVVILASVANSLYKRHSEILAYLVMALPLIAAPFLFWESLR